MVHGVVEQVREAIPHASNVEFTGSNFEGNATRNNSDYDAMINVAPKGSSFRAEHTAAPGFSKLKYESGADPAYMGKYVTEDGYLSGDRVVRTQV